MNVAVIGAGVNGIPCAISLAEKGCKVTVYESKTPFCETNSRSSKLLHGGIRYLETREAAIEKVDDLTNVMEGKWTSTMRLGKMVSDQIRN